MFRSPFDQAREDGSFTESRVFYVFDRPECKFRGNAYQLEGIPVDGSPALIEPGMSFFDRPDQQHLFKLHLPYIWRTAQAVDTLFLPLLNRPSKGLEVQSGLVETDWYPSPVNLISRSQPSRFTFSSEILSRTRYSSRVSSAGLLWKLPHHTRD